MTVNDIKDISILIGIWVAIYGIDSWRREHIGKRQVEIAEESLALFYEASDAISHIRNPLGFSNEFDSINRADGESDSQYESRKQASVVFYRYNQHKELFAHLFSLRYRFMSTFGKEKSQPFDQLQSIVNRILLSARSLGRLWSRNHFRDDKAFGEHSRLVEKYESVFWFQGDQDEIHSEVLTIIDDMEKTCRGIILGKGSLHYFINWKWRKDG
jgi:hypothetical protein